MCCGPRNILWPLHTQCMEHSGQRQVDTLAGTQTNITQHRTIPYLVVVHQFLGCELLCLYEKTQIISYNFIGALLIAAVINRTWPTNSKWHTSFSGLNFICPGGSASYENGPSNVSKSCVPIATKLLFLHHPIQQAHKYLSRRADTELFRLNHTHNTHACMLLQQDHVH